MALLQYVFLFVVFFITNSLQTSEYLECSEGPKPADLIIEGCDKLPCKLKRGTDQRFDVTFDVPEDTETLKPLVNINVMGTTITYPLPNQDACKDLTNANCPLDKGERVNYRLNMPVHMGYPKISMEIKFSLIDEHKKVVACFKAPCKVVDKS